MTSSRHLHFDDWRALIIATVLVWVSSALFAQPPDLPELPTDPVPPTFDLGSSAEAQAEQARTQDQLTVVRNPKPVDLKQFATSLTVFALATCFGLQITVRRSPAHATSYLAGSTALSGVVVVAALLIGTKVLAGTSKSHPITLAALGFLAISLAMIDLASGFILSRRSVVEGKRTEWLAAGCCLGLLVVEFIVAQQIPRMSAIHVELLSLYEPAMAPTVDMAYLVASLLVIACAASLANERTRGSAEALGAVGLFLAIVVTIARFRLLAPIASGLALAIGVAIGVWIALRRSSATRLHVVTLLGGMCGLSSTVVAGAGLLEEPDPSYQFVIAAAFAGGLGAIVFGGGVVGYFRLQGFRPFAKTIVVPAHRLVCLLVAVIAVGLGAWLVQASRELDPSQYGLIYLALSLVALALGAIIILPIERDKLVMGQDWLVCLLGYSVAAIGFMLDHALLIIGGAIVGASCMKLSWRILGTAQRPFPTVGGSMPTPE